MLSFSYSPAILNQDSINSKRESLADYLGHLQGVASDLTYSQPEASIALPGDENMRQSVFKLAKAKDKLKIDLLIVIGIGGSDLGTRAIYNAMSMVYDLNDEPLRTTVFLDTVDPIQTEHTLRLMKTYLKNKKSVLVNVISKSGGTTETMSNFEVILDELRKHENNWQKYVVATTGEGSKLWNTAQDQGFDALTIPGNVGGRFSVFTPVGLFPLVFAGIDIDALLNGAKSMRDHCIANIEETNPAALSAAIIATAHDEGKVINDTFLFSPYLRYIGMWYRQLMGESLGKQHDVDGNEVFTGITPTTSVGSVDLHSVAQLYLGGPADKVTTFVRLKKWPFNIKVPKQSPFDPIVDDMRGNSFSTIMDAIVDGTKGAYEKMNRPYLEIKLDTLDETSLGGIMQLKMIEMIYLGKLFRVNAFDQPNVESYKEITRRLLKQD